MAPTPDSDQKDKFVNEWGCPEHIWNHIENTWTKADAREAALEIFHDYEEWLEVNPHMKKGSKERLADEAAMNQALAKIPAGTVWGKDDIPELDLFGEYNKWAKVEGKRPLQRPDGK